MRRFLRIVLIALLVLLVVDVAGSWLVARALTAARPTKIGPPLPGLRCKPVSFHTADGLLLRGLYVPGADTATAVVLLHGYFGDRTQMYARARLLHDEGYSVLLYDARADGESEGEMTSMGYYERRDLIAAVAWLHAHGAVDVGCIGVSQGGATIALAADGLEGVRCVVLESTYDDMRTAVDRRFRHYAWLPGWLAGVFVIPFGETRLDCDIDSIAPVRAIARLHAPVLVVSGDCDTRVDTADTRRLFDAAREPKGLWFVRGANHEDLQAFDPKEYSVHVLAFIRARMPARKEL